MKLFKFLALTVLLMVCGLSYGQRGVTGSAAFATTVISSTAISKVEFFDSTAVWKINGKYNPNFKKTKVAYKPFTFDHDGYHGMIQIKEKNSGEVLWRGHVKDLKISGMTTGPGDLRDSLAVVNLRTTLFSGYALIPLLFFRFGRRRQRQVFGDSIASPPTS